MISVSNRQSCRICGSRNLRCIYRLNKMPLTDEFLGKDRLGREFLHDIDIFGCIDCGVVQTQHDVDMKEYYSEYEYSVGDSGAASQFMDAVADSVLKTCLQGVVKPRVMEVGSGDGRQLQSFAKLGCEVIGYEPSISLTKFAIEKRGIPTINGLFGDANSAANIPREIRPLDVVFLSYTFDHLPRPWEFLSTIKEVLKPDSGVLVVEVHDLDLILERKEYCLFEHEHTIYLNQESFTRVLARSGFEVISFELVPQEIKRANSLLVAARLSHVAKRHSADFEPPNSLFSKDIEQIQSRLQEIRKAVAKLDDFVAREAAAGNRIAGYGAGGRGVMTLAGMRSGSSLAYVVDKKPKLPGGFLPKSHIPLHSVDKLSQEPVDKVLVFSFGYMDEIRRTLAGMGYKDNQILSMLTVMGS